MSPDETGGAPSRRQFLAVSLSAAALTLAIPLGSACRPTPPSLSRRPAFQEGGWLTIDTTGQITLLVGQTELGQGIHTALAMLVAEELGCAWSQVRVEQAPADPAFANPLMQRQRTAWSASVRGWWKPLREAGAAARMMLVEAAAERWKVAPGGCTVAEGIVTGPGGERATFAELAPDAGRRTPPARVTLKPAASFGVIGSSRPRIELADKVSGAARYGADVRLPGMRFCVLARPPYPGALPRYSRGRITSEVQILETALGIAFVAPTTWGALRARERAAVEWSGGTPYQAGDGLRDRLVLALESEDAELDQDRGDAPRALKGAPRRLEVEYFFPYVAHAPMEPLNCTASVADGRCHVLVPTQDQTAALEAAILASGLPASAVTLETTLAGGGFGRRVHPDVVREAVTVARMVKGPVQVTWSREDDLRHDFYRPACLHRLAATLDGAGAINAWSHQIVGQSASGAAPLPYAIPNIHISHSAHTHDLPTGIWRAVDDGPNACAVECFLDELAIAAQRDPVALRRAILTEPRAAAVLDRAVTASGWGSPLPPGHGRGVALHGMVGSWVALVIEAAVEEGNVRVIRAVAAIDCGTAVNPDGIRAQVEGSIAMGLSAALHETVEIADVGVLTANFDRYRVLRIGEMPAVAVELITSTADPGGVGEPALPPVAPALLNAIADATGIRIRTLPVGNQLRDRPTPA